MDIKCEEAREAMYKAIDEFGRYSEEALIASQSLDLFINKEQLLLLKKGTGLN